MGTCTLRANSTNSQIHGGYLYSDGTTGAQILGALLSSLCIWVLTGVLVYLACERLLYPDYQIQATLMIIVSSCAAAATLCVPKHLSYNGVKELILAVDGVLSVHSLHVWSLTMNQVILSVHIAAGQWKMGMLKDMYCCYVQSESPLKPRDPCTPSDGTIKCYVPRPVEFPSVWGYYRSKGASYTEDIVKHAKRTLCTVVPFPLLLSTYC
ncbi:hypothetical protein MJT46_009259 [Ovis ammon polii x Ovis aries]|nr:hypothetical protein MJT46_009259 [Ovis ammon polii x Ovis aries]